MQNLAENPARTLEELQVFGERDRLEPPGTYREALVAVTE